MNRHFDIWVVDDDPELLELVARTLTVEPSWQVTTFNTPTAVLERVSQGGSPDLIIVDLGMPALDGRLLLKELRGVSALERVPCVVLTAQAEQEVLIEAIESGAADVILSLIHI